jgi:aminomethyltransferase
MDQNAYTALRETAAYIDLSARGKMRATGEDRVRLLHAMCTNHVQELQPGTGCYAFFLTAQGRIIADANIFYMPDYLLIDTEPDVRERLVEHLEKFIIADDVTMHDFTDATVAINLEGPAAERILCELGALPAHIPWSIVEWGHCQLAHWSFTGGPGYSIIAPVEQKQELIAQLNVPEADFETADLVRIENGRPRYGVDFTDVNIPQETQQMHAVHFSKGCYLGQEIVERVRSRGHVNRLLSSLEIDAQQPPARGAKVLAAGKEVGEISSAAFSPAAAKVVALGILRAEAVNAPLQVDGASATVKARPVQTAG